MTTEAIEKIRNAELEAENIEKEAKARAEEVLEKAKADAKNMIEAAHENGKRLIENKTADAVASAENKSAEKSQKLDIVIKELEETAQKQSGAVLDLVIKKLISE